LANGLPKRTINISNPNHIFLQDEMHNNTTYVALSYKWGSKKRYLSCLHNI
jgi:hypothetical protein